MSHWICKHAYPCNTREKGTWNDTMTCHACGTRGAGFDARSIAAPVGITAAEREQKREEERKNREAREAREAEEANKAKK